MFASTGASYISSTNAWVALTWYDEGATYAGTISNHAIRQLCIGNLGANDILYRINGGVSMILEAGGADNVPFESNPQTTFKVEIKSKTDNSASVKIKARVVTG